MERRTRPRTALPGWRYSRPTNTCSTHRYRRPRSWLSNRIPSLAATNRTIDSKRHVSAVYMRMFTSRQDDSFRLILYWKRVGLDRRWRVCQYFTLQVIISPGSDQINDSAEL